MLCVCVSFTCQSWNIKADSDCIYWSMLTVKWAVWGTVGSAVDCMSWRDPWLYLACICLINWMHVISAKQRKHITTILTFMTFFLVCSKPSKSSNIHILYLYVMLLNTYNWFNLFQIRIQFMGAIKLFCPIFVSRWRWTSTQPHHTLNSY